MTETTDPNALPDFSPETDLGFDMTEAEVEDLMLGTPAPLDEVEQLPAPDIQGANFADLTEEELAAIHVIAASKRGASNEFAYLFLADVKEEFETHGVAYRHYVFQFATPSGSAALTSFKRNLTVRISHIRKAAAKQGIQIPPFWVTFTHEQPLEPNERGHSAVWLCTVARMNETQYRGFARERAQKQAAGSSSQELLQKTIGALL